MRADSADSADSADGASSANSAAAVLLAVALTLAVAVADVSAHRRDECLQAARLAIAPGRVELQLDLTPGIAVAGTIVVDIDRNGDGSLSAGEKQAYVERVLNDIALEVDGRRLHLQQPASSHFPDLDAFGRGEGTITLRSNADLPHLSEGPHRLSYRNTHRRDVSVYLSNALVPDSDRVAISAQLRDSDQRDLTIEYVLRDGPESSVAQAWLLGWIAVGIVWALLWRRSSRTATASR